MKKIYLVLIISTILVSGCKSIPELSLSKKENISKTGFLDNNHFQVIIKGKASKKHKGLVTSRENAILKARNSLQETIYLAILKNIYKKRTDSLKHNKKLRREILSYLQYGSIIAEYYDKHNNAFIVYRIKKLNLKYSFSKLKQENQ